ncbi:hypothetical protein GCM10023320_50110 [Pseudonocardia adelaidensis]|uniref:Uncharacterized protein n=1 Tax=Pseudonocardia adelaidensis TaxID=648754 RepID=A0ABP9NP21_9PSEU
MHVGGTQPDGQGPAADPAARTDDLQVGPGGRGGRHEAPGPGQQPDSDPLNQAWHGPSATGGSAAVGHQGSQDRATRDDPQGEVPAQRTGDHERHGVRALADRLLGRHD